MDFPDIRNIPQTTDHPEIMDLHAYLTPAELEALTQRGVIIPCPQQVAVGREVPPDGISPGAVLYPGCRITGSQSRVGAGARLGPGGAAVIENSWVGAQAVIGSLGPVTLQGATAGPGTVLGCGSAQQAVFLGKDGPHPDFTTGYGFRARKGSLYEEDANSAQHTDTKMAILFPWVTLGSNINFCDGFLAGGTGPGLGEFTEVGSGTIHFNFTVRGDKATHSFFGDVAGGVFLDQPRIFVGGNASLLGPLQAPYGAITPAGGRFGKILRPGLNPPLKESLPAEDSFDPEVYGDVKRIWTCQLLGLGQLAALEGWYRHIRSKTAAGDPEKSVVVQKGLTMVRLNLEERFLQLDGMAHRLERSLNKLERQSPGDKRAAQHKAWLDHWPQAREELTALTLGTPQGGGTALTPPPAVLVQGMEQSMGRHATHLRIVRGLSPDAVQAGRDWLKHIAAQAAAPRLEQRVPPLAQN
ncbi:MAG: hypothetical protein OEW12_05990 [Deltaproteobacteria bacterium]|nr:hypothetical protein [Deltaproteobacteria bacterium]